MTSSHHQPPFKRFNWDFKVGLSIQQSILFWLDSSKLNFFPIPHDCSALCKHTVLMEENQRQTWQAIWHLKSYYQLLPNVEGERCTLGKRNHKFVNENGVYARYLLKPLGNSVTWCWLDGRAWRSDAETTSRKTTSVTPAVPWLTFRHLL